MWIAVWAVLSAFVLGVFAWSIKVLGQQKRSWKAYAQKHNLTYQPGKFMQSPVMTGILQGRQVGFYTDAQSTNDMRGQRLVTVIEIELGKGMPVGAAIATKEYVGFLTGMKLDKTYKPAASEWDDSYIIKTDNPAALEKYLTPERVKVLHSLFSMRNITALFFFDNLDAVLRIETTDPLRNPDKMEKIIERLMKAMDILDATGASAQTMAENKNP